MTKVVKGVYVNKYVLTGIKHLVLDVVRLVRDPIRFDGESLDVRLIGYCSFPGVNKLLRTRHSP